MSSAPLIPGHVAEADLQTVVGALISGLNSAPSDSPEAFIEACLMWINRWVHLHGEDAVKAVAPFALVHEVGADQAGWARSNAGWADLPFFREDLPIGVGARICVTTTSMFDVISHISLAKSITDLGAELGTYNLTAQPMVVVDPAKSLIVCCASGVKGPRNSLRLDMSPLVDLTQKVIDDELERFHKEHTEFPDGFAHVFHDRQKRILVSGAEAVVRDNLYLHLKYKAFGSNNIVREDFTSAGRSDVAIYDAQSGRRLVCVIELKVLRSRGMSKTTGAGTRNYDETLMIRHVRMGTRQAQKYKEIASPPAAWAYCCAFDGRDTDTDLPDVKEIASARGVEYRRYYMHTSARDDLDL